jgi:replicative DNA helicase
MEPEDKLYRKRRVVPSLIDPALDEAGKLPPQAPDYEQAVLGCILLEGREPYSIVSDYLLPEHMYVDTHRRIYEVIVQQFNDGIRPDILTVTEGLRTRGELELAGGPYYISQLTNKVARSTNVDRYGRVLLQKYMLRELIRVSQETMRDAYDETCDVFDVLAKHTAATGMINGMVASHDPVSALDIWRRMADDTEKKEFIPMYLDPEMDQAVSMGPGQVTTVGARPTIGKTTLVLNALKRIAQRGHNVAYISLEMTDEQLVAKLAAPVTGINAELLTKNDLNDNERARFVNAGISSPNTEWLPRLFVMDIAGLDASQIYGIFDRLVRRQKVKVIGIDYLQLMSAKGDTGTQEMTNISKAIKWATKGTRVRTINISQLKRRPGADVDPEMSDLRESGQIEADSDLILLLGRVAGTSTMRVKAAKNKLGRTGDFNLEYDLIHQDIGMASAPLPVLTGEVAKLPYSDGPSPEEDLPF